MDWLKRRRPQEPAAVERRAFPRSPAGFRARVLSVSGLPLDRPLLAKVEDISLGGLALSIGCPVEQGSRVRVAMTFPGDAEPVEVAIEVVALGRWVTREYIAHGRFVDLTDCTRSMVQAWTEARGPLTRRPSL
jgi:hypothetical protein